jgi:heme exporter protein A
LTPPLLEARALVRNFGAVRAVDGVSFSLEAGETLTILGPNGAGKSTLLGLLSGTLHPTSGEIHFRGSPLDPSQTAWRAELGLLSHRTFIYGALTARENLDFWARLHGLSNRPDRVAEGLARVRLSDAADRRAGGFSRGMRQRLSLARTLLHDPSLVLLDEPFTGLDLHAAALLRAVLQRLRDGRRSVVLVTHQLAEGIGLADRVAIQSRGRFAFLGAATDLPAGEEERFYRETVEGRIPLEGRIPVEGAVPVGGGPPAADGPLAETAP